MLNKEEEQRLETIIDLFSVESNRSCLPPELVSWLAEKLKEANEELKKVQAEIDRNNEVKEYIQKYSKKEDIPEEAVFNDSKNEISDRFYPR